MLALSTLYMTLKNELFISPTLLFPMFQTFI
jgi:hypothetical protein